MCWSLCATRNSFCFRRFLTHQTAVCSAQACHLGTSCLHETIRRGCLRDRRLRARSSACREWHKKTGRLKGFQVQVARPARDKFECFEHQQLEQSPGGQRFLLEITLSAFPFRNEHLFGVFCREPLVSLWLVFTRGECVIVNLWLYKLPGSLSKRTSREICFFAFVVALETFCCSCGSVMNIDMVSLAREEERKSGRLQLSAKRCVALILASTNLQATFSGCVQKCETSGWASSWIGAYVCGKCHG